MADHGEKVKRLIESFSWGEAGFPDRPAGEIRRREVVEDWMRNLVIPPFQRAASALLARLQGIVEAVRRGVLCDERERLVARIDAGHMTKSPESVLRKMARKWTGDGAPPVGFRDIASSFSDLGRLRIVANFLSDAVAVREALEAPYGLSPPALTEAQQCLHSEFRLRGNALENLVDLDVTDRRSPERSFKGVFEPRAPEAGAPHVCVEVQVMSLLQESWDKKEHVLVYELVRDGHPAPDDIRRELESMSDLLYVVDRTFDRLRSELGRGRE